MQENMIKELEKQAKKLRKKQAVKFLEKGKMELILGMKSSLDFNGLLDFLTNLKGKVVIDDLEKQYCNEYAIYFALFEIQYQFNKIEIFEEYGYFHDMLARYGGRIGGEISRIMEEKDLKYILEQR